MKNKILIIGFILLMAALPVFAATTINFESPTYATGNLVPQDEWITRSGAASNLSVSSTAPLSGAQSVVGTGSFWADHPFVTSDKTTLTMLVKIGAGNDTMIYIENRFTDTIMWMRMNVDGMSCNTTPSGTIGVGSVNAGQLYKIKADFDFPNHSVIVTLINMTDGSGGTATLTLPTTLDSEDITGSSEKMIGLAAWNGSSDTVKYDDINIYETLPPPPAGVIDFEYDAYTNGTLATQDGWVARSGASNLTVSSTAPLSGLQSASGTGNFWVDHNLVTTDVCSLSMLVKIGAGNDTMIYLEDRFTTAYMWIRLSVDGLRCWTEASGTVFVNYSLTANTLYKLNVDFNFPNHKAVVSIKNLSAEGSNFETPAYATGDLAGQDGWIKHWGSYTDMDVSATDPISGAQSLVASPGDNVYKSIPVGTTTTVTYTLPTTSNGEPVNGSSEKKLGLAEWNGSSSVVKYDDIKVSATPSGSGSYNKTTLSILAKFESGTDAFIYLTDRFVEPNLNWIRLSEAGGLSCNSVPSGTQYIPESLVAGNVYKIQVNYNFTSLSAVLSLTDMTTSTYLGTITFKLPSLSNGEPVNGTSEKNINMYNAGTTGNIMFDDISITQSPDVATSTVTGSVFLFNYDYGDSTTVPVGVGLNGIPYYVNLDLDGKFTILDVPNDTYDVLIKATHWLARGAFGVEVAADTDIGELDLVNGDVVDNNEVDFDDINATRAAYGSFPGDENWNWRADVDGSGEVDFSDINIVRGNYGEIGD